jgi:hypothetical protein
MTFLTTQPLWLGVLLVGAATLLAMAGPILVRRRLSLDRLKLNNEVAGFMFATGVPFLAGQPGSNSSATCSGRLSLGRREVLS